MVCGIVLRACPMGGYYTMISHIAIGVPHVSRLRENPLNLIRIMPARGIWSNKPFLCEPDPGFAFLFWSKTL